MASTEDVVLALCAKRRKLRDQILAGSGGDEELAAPIADYLFTEVGVIEDDVPAWAEDFAVAQIVRAALGSVDWRALRAALEAAR